jgi:hypothetical protein
MKQRTDVSILKDKVEKSGCIFVDTVSKSKEGIRNDKKVKITRVFIEYICKCQLNKPEIERVHNFKETNVILSKDIICCVKCGLENAKQTNLQKYGTEYYTSILNQDPNNATKAIEARTKKYPPKVIEELGPNKREIHEEKIIEKIKQVCQDRMLVFVETKILQIEDKKRRTIHVKCKHCLDNEHVNNVVYEAFLDGSNGCKSCRHEKYSENSSKIRDKKEPEMIICMKELTETREFTFINTFVLNNKRFITYECEHNKNNILSAEYMAREGNGCLKCLDISKKKKYRAFHGFDHPMQNPDIFDMAMNNMYAWKKKVIEGKEFIYQGYEDLAIEYLVKNYCGVDCLTTGSDVLKLGNVFRYQDQEYNWHTYYPDIYMNGCEIYYEVKSTYTYDRNGTDPDMRDKLQRKLQCVLDAGFFAGLIVFDDKKNLMLYKWFKSFSERIVLKPI